MKKVFVILSLSLISLSVYAGFADTPYVAGSMQGWDAGANPMTETPPGSGIWETTFTSLNLNDRYEFKITQGNWDDSFPNANSWLYTDDTGEITITFNANNISDGWIPSQNRLGLSVDPGNWTIVGGFGSAGFPEWDNAGTGMQMTPLGHGFYKLSKTLPAATYQWKAVVTGSWDAIGDDGRSINAANVSLSLANDVDFYVDAYEGKVAIGPVDVSRNYLPHDPNAASFEEGVVVDGLTLSWAVALVPSLADPNVLAIDPNLISHKVYMSSGSKTDPNLNYVGDANWDGTSLRATYTPSPTLLKDATYLWRVDMITNGPNDITGLVWQFDTELTTPSVTDPEYQVIDNGGTAIFDVTATSPSTPDYKWYKYVDGINDMLLMDGPTGTGSSISGSGSNTLTITSAGIDDEGGYYCEVDNASSVTATSATALLGIKRMIAKWDFESGSFQSTSPDTPTPTTFAYNDPNFVIAGGISGDAMQFDTDEGAEDLLYTDPDNVQYYDICNYSMTVGCWIKSTFATQWGPMVARNGENGEGWQFRHNGNTQDRISFTTQTASTNDNDEGTPSNRTVFGLDNDWDYAVATFDGSVKKVYINGIISRVYDGDDGSIEYDSDTVDGLITATLSPVSLAGRVKGQSGNLDFSQTEVQACILDEVEIWNYALDATTIAQKYATMTGTPVCPSPQQYDLDGDCIVNLKDLGLLASKWTDDTSVQP